MPSAPTRDLIAQIRPALSPERPLVICDADEVILQFLQTLESYLLTEGLYLDMTSFALTGNIRRRDDDVAIPGDEVGRHLRRFFIERIGDCTPVPGAVDALADLRQDADVVILTNLPHALGPARRDSLIGHGLDYPVITNDGMKGPAVARLIAGRRAPVCFLDDLPPNHTSVKEHAGHVRRLHFVADQRLRGLLPPAPDSHARIDTWPEAHAWLRRELWPGQ